jgi:deazaflavin-dependent oxidoreductase (nitroreductase family)
MSDALPAGLPDWIRDHIDLYRRDPDAGHLWDASAAGVRGKVPTLLLTTTGRKSGNASVLPLIYGNSNSGPVIIASKGGAPSHPAWYLNLAAQPECEVQVARDVFKAVARVATGAEREQLWAEMAAVFPPYNDYAGRTDREIPVVVLERAQ